MSNVTNCTNLAVAGNFASAGNSTVTNLGVSGTLTVNSLAISGTFTQTNISISGNFTQTGTGSFSTGTGPAYLNGSSTLINNGKLLINNSTPNSYWKEIYATDDVLYFNSRSTTTKAQGTASYALLIDNSPVVNITTAGVTLTKSPVSGASTPAVIFSDGTKQMTAFTGAGQLKMYATVSPPTQQGTAGPYIPMSSWTLQSNSTNATAYNLDICVSSYITPASGNYFMANFQASFKINFCAQNANISFIVTQGTQTVSNQGSVAPVSLGTVSNMPQPSTTSLTNNAVSWATVPSGKYGMSASSPLTFVGTSGQTGTYGTIYVYVNQTGTLGVSFSIAASTNTNTAFNISAFSAILT